MCCSLEYQPFRVILLSGPNALGEMWSLSCLQSAIRNPHSSWVPQERHFCCIIWGKATSSECRRRSCREHMWVWSPFHTVDTRAVTFKYRIQGVYRVLRSFDLGQTCTTTPVKRPLIIWNSYGGGSWQQLSDVEGDESFAGNVERWCWLSRHRLLTMARSLRVQSL